jgi:hypothetical protein
MGISGNFWMHRINAISLFGQIWLQGILMSQTVQNFLFQRDILLPGVEAVLFFSHPGLHIEPIHPATRIVQRDGIESFVTGYLQSPHNYGIN